MINDNEESFEGVIGHFEGVVGHFEALEVYLSDIFA
jgi:hypothetical protein